MTEPCEKQEKLPKKKKTKIIAASLITLLACMLFFFMVWILNRYDTVNFDQILYQIKSPVAGTSGGLVASAILTVGGLGGLSAALLITLYIFLTGRFKDMLPRFKAYAQYSVTRVAAFFKKHYLPTASGLLVLSMLTFFFGLNMHIFLRDQITGSDFIEKHYADPETTEIIFPEQKRNLIYIFLESMENTYRDPSAGGNITHDLIPELSALAKENISFTGKNGELYGAYELSGGAWTAAALVAQTSGIPVQVSIGGDPYGKDGKYMPGLTALGDILAKEGYEQSLIFGSDASFAARDAYFTEHGNYNIIDVYSLIENGTLPNGYWEWWGFEDIKLFEESKKELTRLYSLGKPFSFITLTADSHFPDGYVCPLCPSDSKNQYTNVLSCSSRQVYEFIEWCKAQPFYENTTIILSGDHLTMDPEFLEDIDENYTRTIYNCIINSASEAEKASGREFTQLDMFPTALAAMGARIDGDRLGLGTNLFSEEETLTEIYGIDYFSDHLLKKSDFYFDKFFAEKK